MNYRVPSFLLALLFLLMITIGSLQSKTVFACAMMDIVMHECCCVNHKTDKDCVDSSCDVMLESNKGPCCDRSVEISINEDARQDSPLVKPVEIRSDVDPPQAIVSSSYIFVPLHYAATLVAHSQPIAGLSGSNIYLITQRLRI